MGRLIHGVFRFIFWALLVAVVLVAATLTTCRYQADRREQAIASALAPATGQFVDAGDTKIFVQEVGAATAPAVVFVHGTGAWSETWRHTLQQVADAGWRAIAIDLPPFGFSERRASLSYAKAEQGARIVRVLDSLGLSRVVLVGHSFGAGPTVEAALSNPQRLAGLVIVDGALAIQKPGGSIEHETFAPRAIHTLIRLQPIRDSLVATFVTNPRFSRQLLQSFIADPADATDELVSVYQQPMSVRGATPAVGRWLPELIDSHDVAPSQTPAEYAKLAMPVAVLWGRLDTITPLDQAERLQALIPQAQLVVLEDVGHIPQLEDPQRFDEALLKVLAGMKQ